MILSNRQEDYYCIITCVKFPGCIFCGLYFFCCRLIFFLAKDEGEYIKRCSLVIYIYTMKLLNRICLGPTFMFGIDRCVIYKGQCPFNGRLSRFFLLSILIVKYLFTRSLKKIDQLIFRKAKEIYFNEKFPIL